MTTPSVPAIPQRGPHVGRPPLWQGPLFVVGVGALLVAVFARHGLCGDTGCRRLERDIDSAEHILSRADGDPEVALRYVRPGLDAIDQIPLKAAKVHFLAGTAC